MTSESACRRSFARYSTIPAIVLQDEMTAADVDGWDSLAHINLIIAVERKLGIKFATAEISRMKEAGPERRHVSASNREQGGGQLNGTCKGLRTGQVVGEARRQATQPPS